ncbi:Crp/Fnr family transcriptional regulator [Mycobacterium colombiense]|uniref:Crp/Fnr family transcriptional regulator n=1 Tax=Mycobacterium colombiense TaxID=339268 RepID=UPI0007FE0A0C|nr:Crp/Fnr family transcriptional regulator [Mycobacterium colombiense]OBJ13302.1 Crp/Fnr family transcriptional regulator [Mycobacterium colombiense]
MTTAPGHNADHVQVHTSEFDSGQTIFVQGDPGDRVYLIVEGTVKINFRGSGGRSSVRAIIGPTDIFGELAVFDPGPRACTATAITDVRAVWMDRATLRAWMAEQPAIAEQLLRALTRRLRHSERQLVEMVSSDVTARVARQLLVLGKRFGTPEGDALRLAHELNQDEIAQLVGADRVSVNKALRNFTTRGWILLDGKTVVIVNPKALARRADTGDSSGPDPNRRRRPLRATPDVRLGA